MTVDMFKYSQVVWACFILDAAALASTKYTDLPHKLSDHYEVSEEASEIHPNYSDFNATVPTEQQVLPSELGLFIAQPTKVRPLTDGPDPIGTGPDSYHGRNFGFIPLTKIRRGAEPEHLSLFTKMTRNRPKDKRRYNDPDTRSLASDHYLTPEFVKFKNEIERETEKTHLKGLRMSKDNEDASTIVYQRPIIKYKEEVKPVYKNPIPLADDSYHKPSYEDPEPYDDYSTYPERGSYPEHYTSSSDYIYPKKSLYSSHSTIPSEPYLPPGFDSSDFTFPPHPPLPEIESDSYNQPHSESEARIPSLSSFRKYPFHSETPSSYRFPKNKISSLYSKNDEDESRVSDSGSNYYKPRKYTDPENYQSELPGRKQNSFPRRPKQNHIRRPHGKPAQLSIPESHDKEEEDDFDLNFETPSLQDTFLNEEEVEAEAEEEEEEEEKQPPLTPKGRLRQSSRKEQKRIRPDSNRKKRCVKKRKEMSIEELKDDIGRPGREMSCMVCENLDTGGTYETCSYESDPNKNSYSTGSEASYRQGGPKGLKKQRYKRQTFIVNNIEPLKKRVVRRIYEETGSYVPDSDDYDLGNFEDEEEDDMAEFKPQPPAYANDDSCAEVKKGNSICMVCQNPESNGKYEQCSYTTDPAEDSYEYAQSSRYGSGSKSDTPSKKSKEKGRHKRMSQKTSTNNSNPKSRSKNVTVDAKASVEENKTTNATDSVDQENTNSSTQANDRSDVWIPLEWQGLRDIEQKKIESVNKMFHNLVRTKKEQPNSRFLDEVEDSSYEEQFLSLFPELGGSSSEFKRSLLNDFDDKSILDKEKHIPGFKLKSKLGSYFSKKPKKSILDGSGEESEMSKMMKEFANKDRSACTKRMKDKMTCYVCDDNDGIKREECMYVVENEPKKVSYQESKHSNIPGGRNSKREIRKRPLKYIDKFPRRPPEMESSAALLNARLTDVPRNPNSYSNLQIQSQKSYFAESSPPVKYLRRVPEDSEVLGSSQNERYRREEDNDEEDIVSEDPEETGEYQSEDITLEADPSSPDGAFSDDTKSVFDKELKISLPKFMVEKNEHEEMIDDLMKNLERK